MGAVAVAIAVLAITSSAFAATPPRPADPTIVPVESIGGARVGQSGADAEAAWGNVGKCDSIVEGTRQCDYGSHRKGGALLLEGRGDVVAVVEIRAGYKNGDWNFTGPLMDFRTEKGNLGLGSKLTKVAKMFPKADYIENRSVTIQGDGVEMLFFSSDKRHVTQVLLRDVGIN